MTVTEAMFAKVVAERDAFRDLAESAIIAAAVVKYGPLCSGKVVNIRGYYYRIILNNGALTANLISVES
jgi:hypothetical protein